mmetsp:Transcript_28527/g.40084  ORF Transcript_28527/g.40084 Transcript_28527/m.40084 type:complete len:229 (-) Transcript_28527:344-1030(-)
MISKCMERQQTKDKLVSCSTQTTVKSINFHEFLKCVILVTFSINKLLQKFHIYRGKFDTCCSIVQSRNMSLLNVLLGNNPGACITLIIKLWFKVFFFVVSGKQVLWNITDLLVVRIHAVYTVPSTSGVLITVLNCTIIIGQWECLGMKTTMQFEIHTCLISLKSIDTHITNFTCQCNLLIVRRHIVFFVIGVLLLHVRTIRNHTNGKCPISTEGWNRRFVYTGMTEER